VCPDLSDGRGIAFFHSSFQEVADALYEEHVVVIVGGRGKARSGEVQADSLYAGEGVCEDPQPRVFLECG
jgi:hypothetical protein